MLLTGTNDMFPELKQLRTAAVLRFESNEVVFVLMNNSHNAPANVKE